MIENFEFWKLIRIFNNSLDLYQKRREIIEKIKELWYYEKKIRKEDFIELFRELILIDISEKLRIRLEDIFSFKKRDDDIYLVAIIWFEKWLDLYKQKSNNFVETIDPVDFFTYYIMDEIISLVDEILSFLYDDFYKFLNEKDLFVYVSWENWDVLYLNWFYVIENIWEEIEKVVLLKYVLKNKKFYVKKLNDNKKFSDINFLNEVFVVRKVVIIQQWLVEDSSYEVIEKYKFFLYSVLFFYLFYDSEIDNSYFDRVFKRYVSNLFLIAGYNLNFNQAKERLIKDLKLKEEEKLIIDVTFSFLEKKLIENLLTDEGEIEDLFFRRIWYLFKNFKRIKDLLDEKIIFDFLEGKIDERYFERKIEELKLEKKLKRYFDISEIPEDLKIVMLKFVDIYWDKISKNLRKKVLEDRKLLFFVENSEILKKLPEDILAELLDNKISFEEIKLIFENLGENKFIEAIRQYVELKSRYLIDIDWFIEKYKDINGYIYFIDKLERLQQDIIEAKRLKYPDKKLLKRLETKLVEINIKLSLDVLKNKINSLEHDLEKSWILNFIKKKKQLLDLLWLSVEDVDILDFYISMLWDKDIKFLAKFDRQILENVKKFLEKVWVNQIKNILKRKQKSWKIEQVQSFWNNLFEYFDDIKKFDIKDVKKFVDSVVFYSFDQYFDKRWEFFVNNLWLNDEDKMNFKKKLTLSVKDNYLKIEIVNQIYSIWKKIKKLFWKNEDIFVDELYEFYFKVEDQLEILDQIESILKFLEILDEYLDLLFVLPAYERLDLIQKWAIDYDRVINLDNEIITKVKWLYLVSQDSQIIKDFILSWEIAEDLEKKSVRENWSVEEMNDYIKLSEIRQRIVNLLNKNNLLTFTFDDIMSLLRLLKKQWHEVLIWERKKWDHHICYVNWVLVVVPYREKWKTYPSNTIVSIVKNIFRWVLKKQNN